MSQFFFNEKKLNKIAEENAEKYQKAKPCPHIYIDNILPPEVAEELLNEFPTPESDVWENKYSDEHQYKMACEETSLFPEHIREVLGEFNSAVFISFLEKLTGIEGLIPDPYYRGGGMHQIIPGGFLKVHVDFNWHKKLNLERRLNIIFFLNKNWKEEYGGHFELWNKEMTKSEVKVLPVFNRMAIFSTSEDSFHGHPDLLKCPEGMTRKSLALYYYTSPATENQTMAADSHSTLFRTRPGEKLKKKKNRSVKYILKQFVPPIVINFSKKMRW